MTSLLERDLVTDYLREEDKENANKYESYTKLRGFVADSFIKKWAIENLYGEDIAEAHNNGFIHIHDLSDALVPYSYYGKTPILVRGKDQQPFLTSMEKLQGKTNLEVFMGGWEWTEIDNTIVHKSHTDLLKIETTNGRILIITEDHPMFKGFSTKTIPATELVVGDKLCSALFSKNFSFGKKVIPSKLAWLLGMYIAEGSKHGKNYTICQYESLERNKILKILEKYDIDYTICGKDIFIDGDNLIIENIFSLIESGAENKSIPSLSLSKETFFNIISGILDGDGWRTEYDDSASLFGIDSISYELIGQIKTLFDILRIPASFRNYNNIYKLKFHMTAEFYSLFKESIKANRENIKFRMKETFNFDYFNSQPKIKKIEIIPWKGNPVYDISTKSKIFSAIGLKVHNCKGHDATKILTKGLITQTVVADVPKHLSSFFDQLVNLIGTAQQSWAGAQAISNLNTLAAPFVRKYHNELIKAGINEETSEKLTYKYVKQCCQSFVYNLNFPSRAGSQTPFSNITFNFMCPKNMRDEMVLASGCEGTWGDYQKESLMIIEAFNEVFFEGDKKGHPFTFPIVTINLIPETPFDHPLWIDLMKTEIKFGTYSFFNYIGSGINPDSILSMCCRIQVNLSELAPTGGRWSNAGETGCYDDKTEILTDEGWKFFKNLRGDELILAFTEEKELEYQPIINIFKDNYNGDMYHFKSSTFDLKVTPNHKMVIYNGNKTKVKRNRADNLPKTFMIPKNGKWIGNNKEVFILPKIENKWIINNGKHKKFWEALEIPMKDWLAFFGLYLAEGNVDGEKYAKTHGYRTIISQKKPEEREKIEKLLKRFPFHFNKTDNGFEIYNKQLWSYMKQFGNCYTKYIPNWMKMLNSKYLKILLEWFVLGDGNIHKHSKCISSWTASEKLADDLQELYIKIGNNARIFSPRDKKINFNGRQILSNKTRKISESKRDNYWIDQNKNLSIEKYNGKIYCVEIPSHMMFVRRNGIASISGNSIGVVTINLGKLGYLSKGSEYIFMSKLDDMLKISKKALLMKGIFIEKNKKRFMPLDVTYGTRLERFFRTIGVIGLNEACLNMFGTPLSENKEFSYEVLNYIREWTRKTQEETGVLWNLEMTPAEGTATRFAEIDKKLYGDEIITQGVEGAYYYTSMVTPPSQELSILERIDVEENLLPLFTGGTVHRIYIGDHMPNPKALGLFIERIARNTKVPYFDIASTFSVCEECKNTIRGAISSCPVCGGNTSIWDRIVGYYRPRSQANSGKVQEIKDRMWQSIPA